MKISGSGSLMGSSLEAVVLHHGACHRTWASSGSSGNMCTKNKVWKAKLKRIPGNQLASAPWQQSWAPTLLWMPTSDGPKGQCSTSLVIWGNPRINWAAQAHSPGQRIMGIYPACSAVATLSCLLTLSHLILCPSLKPSIGGNNILLPALWEIRKSDWGKPSFLSYRGQEESDFKTGDIRIWFIQSSQPWGCPHSLLQPFHLFLGLGIFQWPLGNCQSGQS